MFVVFEDALFISPHKFLAGPNTPGLLLVKRALVLKRSPHVPSVPGGGTVLFVTKQQHHYLDQLELREEGGTQDIIGTIRAGLAFQVCATLLN